MSEHDQHHHRHSALAPSLVPSVAGSVSPRRQRLSRRMFDNANARWGHFIGTHPHPHILASLALILLLSVHLINLTIEYDIRASFSPNNSKAMREEAVFREFFNLSVSPQRSFVLFKAKDGGSMFRQSLLREVLTLDAEVRELMGRRDSTTGMRACDPLCSLNGPFHIVADSLLSSNGSTSNSAALLLDYPSSTYLGNDLFLGGHIMGVQLSNHTFALNNSRIVSVKGIILWYFNRADTEGMRNNLRELTLRLFEEAQQGERLANVNFEVFGDEIANSEMIRGVVQATILMSIGFLLLLLFVTVMIFRKLAPCSLSPPSVLCIVFTSILCPLLSSLAAFGLSTWMGNRIYTIMCVTPFLIAGVGVDDAFIMLQSWQQHRTEQCVRRRLSLVMVHIGPSVTITSLTNTIAFGIGFLTPTPQMSLFCLCTSIAVFIDYVLTFTLLAPVVVLISSHNKSRLPASRPSCRSPSSIPSPLIRRYSLFLHSAKGRATALLVATLLYAIGISGVLRLNSTFEPSKAFPSDSPLSNSINSLREVFDEFFPINVFVNHPPNISDPVQYAQFNEMVAQLESLPESWGTRRTLLWLRPYEQFDRRSDQFWRSLGFGRHREYRPSYANLAFFLNQLGHPASIRAQKTESDPNGTSLAVSAFQFTVITRHMTEWWNRAIVEEKFRAILARFPEFNASIHDGDSAILNMLLTVKSDLIGSIAVTIVSVPWLSYAFCSLFIVLNYLSRFLVCSLFISDRLVVSAIAGCITSICFTMVGVISWLGADLDPVTMVDVLLATGFSVDYTAHVAHQHHMKKGTSTERIAHSLHEMCPPMLQAGISTLLCMMPLFFVPTYAIVAFAKTIFAVVSVGLLHGLFFLPVLLCVLPQRGKTKMMKTMEEDEEEDGGRDRKREGKEEEEEEEGMMREEEGRNSGRKQMTEEEEGIQSEGRAEDEDEGP